MQQPPPGRPPGPPYRPPQGQPPRAATPPPPGYGGATPPPSGATGYGTAPLAPPPVPLAAPRKKKRGALRFVASSCVFSAWLTLIFSLLFAGGSFLAGAAAMSTAAKAAASSNYFPTPPSATGTVPGLEGDELGGIKSPFGGSPLGGSPLGGLGNPLDMLKSLIAPMSFISGTFTLVSGVVGFILFLGLAQACYALLDLEEQSFQMAQTLQIIVTRLGPGR